MFGSVYIRYIYMYTGTNGVRQSDHFQCAVIIGAYVVCDGACYNIARLLMYICININNDDDVCVWGGCNEITMPHRVLINVCFF